MLTDKFCTAIGIANYAHFYQTRKGTDIPYISHPLAVAALLHDAIEDGGPEYEEVIRTNFGEVILAIVKGCTDGVPDENGQKPDWWERKRAYLDHLDKASDDVLLVSGADKLHNARAILNDLLEVGEAVFDRFTAGKEGTLWYYRSLADIFSKRNAPMTKALNAAVSQIEQLACAKQTNGHHV